MAHIFTGDENDNQLYGTWEDDILSGLAGNDLLFGNDGNDMLAGGTGEDRLDGGRGNNTYLFNPGDGHDTIFAFDPTLGKHSMIRFGEGITPDQIVAERIGMSLRLSIAGTQDSLQIENFFEGGWSTQEAARPFGIEEIRFFGGATWDLGAIMTRVTPLLQLGDLDDFFYGGNVDGGGGNDRLDGDYSDNLLRGGAGDDQLFGNYGNDVLVGGAGNDTLEGGAGVNIFQFAAGWGSDTILLRGWGGEPQITQIELRSVQAGTVAMERSDGGTGMDLIMWVKGNGTDAIIVKDYFNPAFEPQARTLRIVFEGYETWDANRIQMAMTMPPGQMFTGTEGNDFLTGLWGDDTLKGGGGDDQLDGNYGNDLLDAGEGNDNLQGREGNDVLLGGNGADMLQGGMGDDMLDGGAGDDVLDGGEGHNLIAFGRESGQDMLVAYPNATNTIVLGADVRPEDMIVSAQSGYELIMAIRGSTATLRMPLMTDYQNGTPVQHAFAELRFADGTVWDEAQLMRQAYTGDDERNQIYGSQGDDWIDGRGGDDILEGRMGNDRIDGGAGNDFLRGDEGNDALRGGQGDDILDGGSGDNTFRFANGDGRDVVIPVWGRDTQTVQTIVFDAGIAPADVTVRYNNNGYGTALEFTYNHGFDQIAVPEFRRDGSPDLSIVVRFADGSTWNNAELDRRSMLGDDGFNEIRGTEGDDVLDGQGGDDNLKANGGNDTLLGGEGNDFLDGGAGNDTIVGGRGADFISAHDQGSDTYVFNPGDGSDVIGYAPWGLTGGDTIRFGAGIAKTDLHLWVNGNTLNIHYGSGDIRVDNFLQQDGQTSLISTFAFADGATYTYRELSNHAPLPGAPVPNMVANEGKDFLFQLPPDAFIDTDPGDTLRYELRNEFGKPLPAWLQFDPLTGTISGKPGFSDSDQMSLVIKAIDTMGASAESRFSLEVRDGNQAPVVAMPIPDLQVADGTFLQFAVPAGTFADPDQFGGGSMSASNLPAWLSFDSNARTFKGTPSYGDVGQYAVNVTWTDDGGLSVTDTFKLTVATAPAMTLNGSASADILSGKSGNDTLNGFGGNDTLNGGFGADRMVGGSGDDIYYVDQAGDTVIELGAEGNDLVYASVSHTLAANVERLTLSGTAAINATGNNLSNLLVGNSGANLLDGGTGADTMSGGAGNDTYVLDNGSDVVNEAAGEGMDRILSAVGRTLGNNQEILTLTGSNSNAGTGNSLKNLIQGNSGINALNGADGYDILQGAGGNDNLSDSSLQGNVFDGGAGDDKLSGGNGADLFIGGSGIDTLTLGNGADIIAFNRGDGQDAVAVTSGADNAVSLGHGILFADLALTRAGGDLILNLGAGEQLAFKGWYSSGGRSVSTLQVVTEGGTDYQPGSAPGIHDNKIEQFNFSALVARYDALRAADPALTTWNMADSLAQFSTGGSDTTAIGGDLAYHYATGGALLEADMLAALVIVGTPQAASTLHEGITLQY